MLPAPPSPSTPNPASTGTRTDRLGAADLTAALERLWSSHDQPSARARLLEMLVALRDRAGLQRLFASPAADPTQAALEAAVAAHLAGDLERAIAGCRGLIAQQPTLAAAHNHLGRALFNRGAASDALAAFQQAVAAAPGYAEAENNLGHVLRAQGRGDEAQGWFERAAEHAPWLLEARLNLAIGLLAQARAEDALAAFEAVLAVQPEHLDARLNAGTCLHMLRRYDEAVQYYRLVMAAPQPPAMAYRQLGKLYIETARIDQAIACFQQALTLWPQAADLHAELISTLELANRLDQAEAAVAQALQRFPADPVLQYEQAKLQRRRGDRAGALAQLQAIDPRRLPPQLHQWFFFELGTALDANDRYPEAFAAFAQSNALAGKSLRARSVDRGALDRVLDALADWTAAGMPCPAFEAGEDLGEDLVFLLGFPRSGTTLLDLMLDGHAAVRSLEERQTMEHVFWQVDQTLGRFPHGLIRSSAADRQALRALYRRRLAEEGVVAEPGRITVDKMPMRSPYAGFIHRLFPRARILFALRHPLDVVLSNYMQNYAANDVFVHFNDLGEIARIYSRVMDIWRATAPQIAPEVWRYVRYEDLVEDRDRVLQGVCSLLGLPWEAEMSDHLRTLRERPHIKTNSYQQVTQPIYRRSSGRWRHYLPQLQPILPTLRPHIRGYDYPDPDEIAS